MRAVLLLCLALAACSAEPPPAAPAPRPATIPVPADVAAPPATAVRTASGLAYLVLQPGSGAVHPGPRSVVEVHYSGWTADGRMFDSSVARGAPLRFPLDRVIPGWTEAVQLMVVGERSRFWIPGQLAYANSPRPDAPRGQLTFDIELIAIR